MNHRWLKTCAGIVIALFWASLLPIFHVQAQDNKDVPAKTDTKDAPTQDKKTDAAKPDAKTQDKKDDAAKQPVKLKRPVREQGQEDKKEEESQFARFIADNRLTIQIVAGAVVVLGIGFFIYLRMAKRPQNKNTPPPAAPASPP